MILTSVTLQNFRSYAKKIVTCSDTQTIIIGPNASGKTNILEAVMLLATGKSFRASQDREVIRWGEEIASIECRVSSEIQLRMLLTTAPQKKYFVNGIPRRMIDFVGNVRAVLFWPEDLEIVTDSPSIRRKYLDTVLLQVDREYRRNLFSYERGLRQRNKLLDLINNGKASRAQLIFWNQLLIRAGGYVTDKRAAYIDFVNAKHFPHHDFAMRYDKSVISQNRLEQYKDEELAAKATLVGPHRDNFSVLQSERDLNRFGSRGEQRVAVLWMKMAELDFIEELTEERPVLLLDDIFSELDEEHRDLVGALVGRQQTIITSADIEAIPKDIRHKASTIQL